MWAVVITFPYILRFSFCFRSEICLGATLGAAAKERECVVQRLWRSDIINHLLWDAASTEQGKQLISPKRARWTVSAA